MFVACHSTAPPSSAMVHHSMTRLASCDAGRLFCEQPRPSPGRSLSPILEPNPAVNPKTLQLKCGRSAFHGAQHPCANSKISESGGSEQRPVAHRFVERMRHALWTPVQQAFSVSAHLRSGHLVDEVYPCSRCDRVLLALQVQLHYRVLLLRILCRRPALDSSHLTE